MVESHGTILKAISKLALLDLALTVLVALVVYALWPDDRAVAVLFLCIWFSAQAMFGFLIATEYQLQKAEKLIGSINDKTDAS